MVCCRTYMIYLSHYMTPFTYRRTFSLGGVIVNLIALFIETKQLNVVVTKPLGYFYRHVNPSQFIYGMVQRINT